MSFRKSFKDGLERREHLREEITFYFPEERLLDLNLVPIIEDKEVFRRHTARPAGCHGNPPAGADAQRICGECLA